MFEGPFRLSAAHACSSFFETTFLHLRPCAPPRSFLCSMKTLVQYILHIVTAAGNQNALPMASRHEFAAAGEGATSATVTVETGMVTRITNTWNNLDDPPRSDVGLKNRNLGYLLSWMVLQFTILGVTDCHLWKRLAYILCVRAAVFLHVWPGEEATNMPGTCLVRERFQVDVFGGHLILNWSPTPQNVWILAALI